MARFAFSSAFALTLLFASAASAQQKPPPGPAPAPIGPGTDQALEPKLPAVDDPMLVPVPPPKHVLANWRQAVEVARNRSSVLQLSRAEVEEAQGLQRQALAGSLPRLIGRAGLDHNLLREEGVTFDQGTGQFERTSVPDPATSWNAALTLSVPVFAPQAWYDASTAKRATRAARLTAKETERLVLATIADAIVGTVTAERVAEVSRVSLGASLNTYELNRRRAELGAASAVDVLRADQEVALARAQVVAADESVRRSREQLGLALGSAEAWSVRPDIQLDALASEARTSCRPETTVERRPDIVARRAEVELAERSIGSVNRKYWPTVDAVSTLTYVSDSRVAPNPRWTIGGVLTWVLYDGGLRYGEQTTNEARLRAARERLTDARRQATIEVTQSLRAVQVAEANLAVSGRSRQIAAQSARLSRIAFLNGSGTSFDLVETSRRWREAELDFAIKEFEVVRAKVAALLALASCAV